MSDIIILDVAPSAAIVNSNDLSQPIKTRKAGASQPRYQMEFLHTATQQAYWSWPIPPAASLGELLTTSTIKLHWSANSSLANEVRWAVSFGYMKDGDDVDKVLGAEVLSAVVNFGGIAYKEETTTIALGNLFAALPTSDSARLVVRVRRELASGITNPLESTVELYKSQLILDFKSQLEIIGPYHASVQLSDALTVATLAQFGHHLIVNTGAGNRELQLPNEGTVGAADDGKVYLVSMKGANVLSVNPEPAGATTLRGCATPCVFPLAGDSARFVYIAADNVYQFFG